MKRRIIGNVRSGTVPLITNYEGSSFRMIQWLFDRFVEFMCYIL